MNMTNSSKLSKTGSQFSQNKANYNIQQNYNVKSKFCQSQSSKSVLNNKRSREEKIKFNIQNINPNNNLNNNFNIISNQGVNPPINNNLPLNSAQNYALIIPNINNSPFNIITFDGNNFNDIQQQQQAQSQKQQQQQQNNNINLSRNLGLYNFLIPGAFLNMNQMNNNNNPNSNTSNISNNTTPFIIPGSPSTNANSISSNNNNNNFINNNSKV